MKRKAFTLVETLIVLAILLLLFGLGVGLWAGAVEWWDRVQTDTTLVKVTERLSRTRERIRREAKAWETPPDLIRRAGGNVRRAEVLKHKYLAKWAFPESYAEVEQGLAESKLLAYPFPSAPAGYPPLVEMRQHLRVLMADGNGTMQCDLTTRAPVLAGCGITAAQDLDLQNAACLVLAYRLALGSSVGDLGTSELGSWPAGTPDLNFVAKDRWGTPLRFRRWGEGQAVQQLPDWIGGSDPDDPDALLQESDPAGARTLWWDVNGRWFVLTFRHDPTLRPFLPFLILSAGRDRTFGTEDDLDSLRAGSRRNPY